MRTQGTFQGIYAAARSDTLGDDEFPTSPGDLFVARRDGGVWMIESALEPAPNADFQCDLNEFHDYWLECYDDPSYIPTARDVAEFVTVFAEDDE